MGMYATVSVVIGIHIFGFRCLYRPIIGQCQTPVLGCRHKVKQTKERIIKMITVEKIKCNGFLCLSSATRHNAIENVSHIFPNGNSETVPMCERCSTCAQGVWQGVTITVI